MLSLEDQERDIRHYYYLSTLTPIQNFKNYYRKKYYDLYLKYRINGGELKLSKILEVYKKEV